MHGFFRNPSTELLNFKEEQLVPKSLRSNYKDDVPVSIYHMQWLLRALGHLPRGHIPLPARSFIAPALGGDGCRGGQFIGEYSVCSWNAQAFFTTSLVAHASKPRYANSLLCRSDVLLLQEAHGAAAGDCGLEATLWLYCVVVCWAHTCACRR